jgi:hypothetical protein
MHVGGNGSYYAATIIAWLNINRDFGMTMGRKFMGAAAASCILAGCTAGPFDTSDPPLGHGSETAKNLEVFPLRPQRIAAYKETLGYYQNDERLLGDQLQKVEESGYLHADLKIVQTILAGMLDAVRIEISDKQKAIRDARRGRGATARNLPNPI